MKTIYINTASSSYECDICGWEYVEGGSVYVDGKFVLEREPDAYYCGGPSYSGTDLLIMALFKMGITVYVNGKKYHITSHDDEYHEEG